MSWPGGGAGAGGEGAGPQSADAVLTDPVRRGGRAAQGSRGRQGVAEPRAGLQLGIGPSAEGGTAPEPQGPASVERMENPKTRVRGGVGTGVRAWAKGKGQSENQTGRVQVVVWSVCFGEKVASGRRTLALLLSFTRKVTRRCHYLWPLVSVPFLYTTPLERASPL